MIIYHSMIVWILLVAIVANRGINLSPQPGIVTPSISRRASFFMMGYIVFFIGLRSAGADTYAYITSFNNQQGGKDAIITGLRNFADEGLFEAFGALIKTFTTNYHVYLFLICAISGFALAHSLRKYSPYFTTSLLLFMLAGSYTWMINGIRQFLAATLAFAATELLLKKKTIAYILLIILLSSIHTSALIFIPVYFLVQGPAWSRKTLLMIALAVFAISFTGPFLKLLGLAVENTNYAGVMKGEIWDADNGSNPIRSLIFAVPPIWAFIKRQEINEKGDALINLCVNMSIVCLSISVIANVTSGVYIGRLPIYFSLYNLILLPWLVINTGGRNRNIWYYAMIVAYTALYFYADDGYYYSDILNLNL